MSRVAAASIAASVLLALTACEPSTAPEDTATLRIMLSEQAASAFMGTVDPATAMGPGGVTGHGELLDPAAVDAIVVTVTGVQVLEAGTGPGYGPGMGPGHGGGPGSGPGGSGAGPGMSPGGSWTAVPLATPTAIDLLALPAEGLLLAEGGLEPGTYAGVRILFEQATVSLSRTVTTSGGTVYQAGTHPLLIGGGYHDWIVVPTATFEVDAARDADILVTFDPDASVRAIVAAPDGSLRMPPVLHAWAHPPGTGGW